MNYLVLLFLFLFVVFLGIQVSSKYSEFTRVKSKIDNRYYQVRYTKTAQESADLLAKVNQKVKHFIDFMTSAGPEGNAPFDEDIIRLKRRYDPDNLSEATNETEHSSYTVNKGEKVALCLRCRDCSSNSVEPLNTIMFVVLHELAHIANNEEGHGAKFQSLNSYFLKKAIECQVWNYQNYSDQPVSYCNTTINATPM